MKSHYGVPEIYTNCNRETHSVTIKLVAAGCEPQYRSMAETCGGRYSSLPIDLSFYKISQRFYTDKEASELSDYYNLHAHTPQSFKFITEFKVVQQIS